MSCDKYIGILINQQLKVKNMPSNKDQDEIQDKDKLPQIRFETTSGTFDVELEHEKAPITVNNFLNLVNDGYYENLIFHRVIQGFVIQTGGLHSRNGLQGRTQNDYQ